MPARIGSESMRFAGWLGLGSRDIMAQESCVQGCVTGVKRCWWLKINTKPVRRNGLDGAVFPHTVFFRYSVDGTQYQGSRYVSWRVKCPGIGDTITVYVDRDRPEKYAVKL